MQSLEQPRTLKIYLLLRQTGLNLIPTGMPPSTTSSLGVGFYFTHTDAEYARTIAILNDTAANQSNFHIFELEIPNPAYQE